MESIIVSAVTGICSIIGVIIASAASANKLQKQLEISQAVMNTKLESLTNEVRAHNEFARRMPVIEEQIKVINHRLDDLERDNNA
jgi:DNA-binding HxlR family transcriptional regulator